MATTCVEHAELCLLVAAGDVDKDWFLLQVTNESTASGHVTTIPLSDWAGLAPGGPAQHQHLHPRRGQEEAGHHCSYYIQHSREGAK